MFEKARYLENYRSRTRSDIAGEEIRVRSIEGQGQRSRQTTNTTKKTDWHEEPRIRKKLVTPDAKSPESDGTSMTPVGSGKIVAPKLESSDQLFNFTGSRDQYTCLTRTTSSVFGCKPVGKDDNSNSVQPFDQKISKQKQALNLSQPHLSSCICSASPRHIDRKFGLTPFPGSEPKNCCCEDLNSIPVDCHKTFPLGVEIPFGVCLTKESKSKRLSAGKCKSEDPDVPAHLRVLYKKEVVWAHHVQRPLNCWLGKFGVPHVGVIVTTEDGEKWLVHKAKTNGTMDTVVSDLNSLKSNWSVKSSKPVAGYTVGDFVKASGSKYNLLTNNCWDSRKRMMQLCDDE